MKHVLKVLCLLLVSMISMIYAGCTSTGQSQTCTYETDGVVINYTLIAKDDVLQKITQVSTITFSAFSGDDRTNMESELPQAEAAYAQIKGVEYSYDITDETLTETIVIDAANEDTVRQLSQAGLLPIEGGGTKLSLKKTIKNMEKQGFTVK